jgi:cytosine/adenosine deaminase-related metal-dependent hydrolase
MADASSASKDGRILVRGARYALNACESKTGSILIDGGRVAYAGDELSIDRQLAADDVELDLNGFLLLPGLVNPHDHLQFALYPRLGNGPYRNYIEWGADIHVRNAHIIAKQHELSREVRLWWGGLRNLLCGVTTVCHHDPLWPSLQGSDFPVRVVKKYGWAHSLALGGDLAARRASLEPGAPFILHACEGVDERAREEVYELDRRDLIDANTVLVHGLALDEDGISLLRKRGASLILCPSSNEFLFDQLPSVDALSKIKKLSLGSDSSLTAQGDLLDEIRLAVQRCGIRPATAYAMVTYDAASILQLDENEGTIAAGGMGDFIAVRDGGLSPAGTLASLSTNDVELVIIGGCVQLASDAARERLPAAARSGLEPCWIDDALRWIRGPVTSFLRQAEKVLGVGQVRLGGRRLHVMADHRAGS